MDKPEIEPDMVLRTLLPLRMLVITLEAVSESRPAFFHQAALMAFLRFLADSPDNYDHYIRLDAPESGRIHYLPGDYYRFTLIGLQGGDSLLDTILKALSRLPDAAPKTGAKIPFCDNWRLHRIQDAFTEAPVDRLSQTTLYDEQQLQQEAALWSGKSAFTWRWLTPARLLKDKRQREGVTKEARYCRDSSDLSGDLLLCRLHDSIADLLRRRGASSATRKAPPAINLEHAHLFWMDAEYRDPEGKTKEVGGVTGRIEITLPERLPHRWWSLLILGQYLGIGQSTTFGWGRYQLVAGVGSVSCRRTLPATSLLTQVKQAENLAGAWRHVMSNIDTPPTQDEDEDDPYWRDEGALEEEPLDAPLDRLTGDIDKLLTGKYRVPCLHGYLVPKRDGGVRPLAIPPLHDRVLQRSLAQVLTPALDKLMYRHSHGYRPGHSRMTARYEIQAAWRAGYRWVYESDIEDFFDSVDLQRLRDRLSAIYGDDPLVEAIIGWMSAAVKFRGETIQRKNGLPQGSPLSPLMANLMLDDFDSDMEKAGFHLIRFADDFIIMCKEPDQAQAAGEAARRSLQEHGLNLNSDKTHVTAMDRGFKYLGYLFVNDMALDISGTDNNAAKAPQQAPPNSWLSQLSERAPVRVKQEEAILRLSERPGRGAAVTIGERDDNGTLLSLTGDHSVVSTLNKNIRIHRKDKLLYNLPWNSLQAVILFGNHQITTQAMHAAMRYNVPIHLSSGSGVYYGMASSNQATQGERIWLQQLQTFQDHDKALYCAREIVSARLIHMKENLRRRQQAHGTTQIDNAIRHAGRAESLDSLRGLEGSATREYYQFIARILPEEFGFSGRNRRPPRDPFNVLLSMGYTVLYGYTQSILHAVGLLPRQGFYHQPRGRHAALASDLMEPFRHMVERSAMTVILRREISLDDFSYSPAGACIIDSKARRKYLSLLLMRWESGVKARGETETETYFTHLHKQALSVKGFIWDGTPFKAWRIR